MDFTNKIFFSISGKYFLYGVNILYSIILINYLGIDLYAIYSVIFIIPLLVVSIGSLGIGQSIIYHVKRNTNRQNGIMLWMCVLFWAILSFVYCSVLFLSADFIFEYLNKGDITVEYDAMILSWLIIPVLILRKYLISFLRGYYKINQVVIIESMVQPVLKVVFMAIIYIYDLGLYYIILTLIVVELIAIILTVIQLNREVAICINVGKEAANFKRVIAFELKSHTGTIFQKLNVDLVMLLSMPLITSEEIAFIMLSLKFLNIVNLPIGGLINVLVPKISRSDFKKIVIVGSMSVRVSILIVLAALPFLWIFSEDVITLLYGDTFIGIGDTIKILFFGVGFLYITNIMLVMLTYFGKPKYKIYARFTGLMLSLSTLYSLHFVEYTHISEYSIVAGYLMALLLSIYFVNRHLDINFRDFLIIKYSDIIFIYALLRRKLSN